MDILTTKAAVWDDGAIVKALDCAANWVKNLPFVRSLSGNWKFFLASKPSSVPLEFYDRSYEDSSWDTIPGDSFNSSCNSNCHISCTCTLIYQILYLINQELPERREVVYSFESPFEVESTELFIWMWGALGLYDDIVDEMQWCKPICFPFFSK